MGGGGERAWQELRYALRRLIGRPWHTAAVVAIFAVGGGTSLTVFRLADAVLLHSLPYRAPERIVRVAMRVPLQPATELPYADVGYRALEKRNRVFDVVASYRELGVNLTKGERPMRVLSARVTGNFFDVFGLRPQLGRQFRANEETPKEPAQLVLSDAFWRTAFGGDPAVVGTTVRVDGAPATIVGVADPRLTFPAATVAYFTLMDLDPVGTMPFELGLDVVARMRTGVTLDAARRDATRIAREVAHENPSPHRTADSDVSGFEAIVRSLHDDLALGVTSSLALLGVAVVLVLVLACVNVAALELARSSTQRTELAIRAALGAERTWLIRTALVEAAIQAIAGAALGLALSRSAIGLMRDLTPDAFGLDTGGRLTAATLGAAAVAVMSCIAASSVFPIALALRDDLQATLRARAGSSTVRLSWLRRGLIVAQTGFACALVYGAGVMVATVRDAQRAPLGFAPNGLWLFSVNLPPETYAHSADVASAFQVLTDRVRSIPGVTNVGLADHVPLAAEQGDIMVGVEGRVFKADGTDPAGDLRVVSPGYFASMGIRTLEGRAFTDGDSYADGTPAVISQGMAKLLWPDGADPVGHRVRIGPFSPWLTIVGVVSDVRNRLLTEPPRAELYLPFGAPRSPVGISREMTFVLRTRGATAGIAREVQRVVAQTNPDLPIYAMTSYDDIIARSQRRQTTLMRTLSAFAAIALVLAAAGTYALLMFSVVQRRRELAVRQAVGASALSVATMIGRETASLLVAGMGVGLLLTILDVRLLAWRMGVVSPIDLRAAGATAAIIAAIGCAAALLPARRAAATDPMLVLKDE